MKREPLLNNHFYVLSGGPGAGKTAVITELKARRFYCVEEIARQLIKDEVAAGGNALPWKDAQLYTKTMLERSVESYLSMHSTKETIFFDRGIPDAVCQARLIDMAIDDDMDFYTRNYRYNKTVFLFPPWKEIYVTDDERKQSWEEVINTYEVLADTYHRYDYTIVELPQADISERADFVLHHIESLKR